ncbi:MAG: Haloacid dehalogenase domain protein hydrolase [Deltaproteobacteria bacterium]|nr:Haloacid dehalogenase domain protein hydrolase [Deltaproteobacteria bacterium]
MKPISPVRCVIYDCDGVLFDSLDNNERFYNRVCAALGRAPVRPEELPFLHMHTVQEALPFLFPGKPDLVKKAHQFILTINPNDFIPYMKMEPNLLEALDTLKQRGVRRAINTNRTNSMQFILDAFSLRPYFELVVTALDVQNPKPHPESVKRILDAFRLGPEEAVFVGDSEIDRRTAEAADIRFIAYKNPRISNGCLIQDHQEILNLLV